MCIRPATPADASRIAEIIVFNNRLNYFPIFRDEGFSFGTVQVLPLANRFLNDPELLGQTWVYDDGVVKGLTVVKGAEIDKLYVEPSFQGRGIPFRRLPPRRDMPVGAGEERRRAALLRAARLHAHRSASPGDRNAGISRRAAAGGRRGRRPGDETGTT